MAESVIALIFDEDKQNILTIKRRDVPVWVLPGGGIDPGESPEDAVKREVLEETCCNVSIVRKVAEYAPINSLSLPTHLFECRYADGNIDLGEETRAIGFYPLDALPEPFFFLHKDWILDALQNNQDLIRKPIYQVTYTNLFLYILKHPIQVLRLALSRLGMPLNKKG